MLTKTTTVTKTNSKASIDAQGVVSFFLPLAPMPAPRPRIRVLNLKNGKRMGVAYYAGKYKDFLAEAPKAIPESPKKFAKGIPLQVDIHFACTRPQKPANPYPVGDIDNYCKGILDAITKNGTYWSDDAQVIHLAATKRYVGPDEAVGHSVYITPTE